MIAARLAKIGAFLAAIEVMFWLYGTVSIHRGNPFRLYDPARLAAQIKENLPVERSAPPTGWYQGLTERPHPIIRGRRCATAWGGSFTVSSDVSDSEAWPYLASVKLGCEIANLGVDGFGFDQTLLLFEADVPRHSVIILGMAQPMITVSAAASWTFIDLDDHRPRARITKPFFSLNHDRTLHLEPRPPADVAAIMQHYAMDDFGRSWTPLRFPFSFSVVEAVYLKWTLPNLLEFGVTSDLPALKRQRDVATAIIKSMADVAERNDDRFVVLLIPRPEDAKDADPELLAMFNSLAAAEPHACLVNPYTELRHAAASLSDPSSIRTAMGHFNALGNAALAEALVRGIASCGIVP
jgi:hypothetical protein